MGFQMLLFFFYLALSPIHRLLVKLLADVEVDLGGAHTGGRFDVELFPVLADLHMGVGGRRHGHFPQHGVHSWPGAATVGRHRGQFINDKHDSLITTC